MLNCPRFLALASRQNLNGESRWNACIYHSENPAANMPDPVLQDKGLRRGHWVIKQYEATCFLNWGLTKFHQNFSNNWRDYFKDSHETLVGWWMPKHGRLDLSSFVNRSQSPMFFICFVSSLKCRCQMSMVLVVENWFWRPNSCHTACTTFIAGQCCHDRWNMSKQSWILDEHCRSSKRMNLWVDSIKVRQFYPPL